MVFVIELVPQVPRLALSAGVRRHKGDVKTAFQQLDWNVEAGGSSRGLAMTMGCPSACFIRTTPRRPDACRPLRALVDSKFVTSLAGAVIGVISPVASSLTKSWQSTLRARSVFCHQGTYASLQWRQKPQTTAAAQGIVPVWQNTS